MRYIPNRVLASFVQVDMVFDMNSAASIPHAGPSVRPRELFFAFLIVGLSGFGGVLPWARRVLVERRGWLAADAFTDILALCQSLPGPNIVNLSVVVGGRVAGAAGALAAVSGLVGAPVGIVICLAAFYERFGALHRVSAAIAALGAAASGLVVAMAIKMAAPLLARNPITASAFIAVTFCSVAILREPLPLVFLGLVPVGAAIAWFTRRAGGKT